MSIKTAITAVMLCAGVSGAAQAESFSATSMGEMFDQSSGFEAVFLGAGIPDKYRTGVTQNRGVIAAAAIMTQTDDEHGVQLAMDSTVQAIMAEWAEQDEWSVDITVAAMAGAYLGAEDEPVLEVAGATEVINRGSWLPETGASSAIAAGINHRPISNFKGDGVQVVDGRPIFDMQTFGVQIADGRPIFETYDMTIGSPIVVSFNSGS